MNNIGKCLLGTFILKGNNLTDCAIYQIHYPDNKSDHRSDLVALPAYLILSPDNLGKVLGKHSLALIDPFRCTTESSLFFPPSPLDSDPTSSWRQAFRRNGQSESEGIKMMPGFRLPPKWVPEMRNINSLPPLATYDVY